MAFGAKIKLTIDKSGKKEFRDEIQKYVDQATKGGIKLTNFTVKLKAEDRKAILNSVSAELAKSPIKISKIDASGAIKSLKSQLTTMLSGLQIGGLGAFLGTDGVEQTYQKAVDAAKRLGEANNAAANELKTLQSMLHSTYKSAGNITDAAKLAEYIEQYRILAKDIERAKTLEGNARDEVLAKIQRSVMALKQQVDAQRDVERQTKKTEDSEARLQKRSENLQKRVLSYMQKNTKAAEAYGNEFNELLSLLSGDQRYKPDVLDKVELQLIDIQIAAKKAGLEGDIFYKKIQDSWSQIGGFAFVTAGLHQVVNAIKQMIPAVKELDAAMTELRKVTDLTDAAYDHFYNQAVAISERIGSKISDTISATADFARLGYSVEDAAAMAEAALVYKNVGDGIEDISVATESLISTIKAFGEESYSAMQIVDMFNEVGKFCPAA